MGGRSATREAVVTVPGEVVRGKVVRSGQIQDLLKEQLAKRADRLNMGW